MVRPWTERAACRGTPLALWFTPGREAEAAQLCAACPVRLECLEVALVDQLEYGIWGGLTAELRAELLRIVTAA